MEPMDRDIPQPGFFGHFTCGIRHGVDVRDGVPRGLLHVVGRTPLRAVRDAQIPHAPAITGVWSHYYTYVGVVIRAEDHLRYLAERDAIRARSKDTRCRMSDVERKEDNFRIMYRRLRALRQGLYRHGSLICASITESRFLVKAVTAAVREICGYGNFGYCNDFCSEPADGRDVPEYCPERHNEVLDAVVCRMLARRRRLYGCMAAHWADENQHQK